MHACPVYRCDEDIEDDLGTDSTYWLMIIGRHVDENSRMVG
jgi:hypothetical protein